MQKHKSLPQGTHVEILVLLHQTKLIPSTLLCFTQLYEQVPGYRQWQTYMYMKSLVERNGSGVELWTLSLQPWFESCAEVKPSATVSLY